MSEEPYKTALLSERERGKRGISFAAGTETGQADRLGYRRNRLAAAAVILCGCFAVAVVIKLLTDDKIWQVQAWLLVGFLGALALLLGSRRPLSPKSLQIIELSLLGSASIWIAGQHYSILVHFAEQGERAKMLTSANGAVFGFFVMAVIYGLIIPNRWQKTALIVGVMALFPLVEPFLHLRFHPVVLDVAPEIMSRENLIRKIAYIVIGAIIAVYGAHSLNSLRRAVQAAKQIGQYRLERLIGEGGMGQVWQARHALLARPAAIKLIRTDALVGGMEDQETAIQRFEREAQSTASLKCPNTIEVFDFGTTSDGSCYYAMEFLDGVDLETLVQKHGPVDAARTVFIWRQVCRSLAEAHHAGMVHRDIKPANIYLCRQGLDLDFVKVLDFGLVKFPENTGDDVNLTRVGVLGTPAFISPDAMEGRQLDGRSDIYATACVAYWLLTGKFIFDGNAMTMAMAHARDEPRRPSQRTDVEIPAPLETLVMRCLSKHPDDRPTALELIDELDATGLADSWSNADAERWWRLNLD